MSALTSASSRVLQLRMRQDLRIRSHEYLGRKYWVIKDPLCLKYYRFEDEEFAILQMLDRQVTLDDLQEQFERRFAPQKISRQELHQFIGMLHRASLVVSEAPGQGRQLLQRRSERIRKERMGKLLNLLSIRFQGFDPDRLLNRLNGAVGWFFTLPCLIAVLIAALCAAILVGTQFDTFSARLPTFELFFNSQNWVWLALALGFTKVLHEFGHGLACKRFGGECHEMGVMLLVLTPCLYCNVSDSWMLPSKWQRAAIGAAGMYVELTLATICTFLWWFTQPGLLHYLCLNVIVVCSISTLLFNANPLLRYDGYYILSDLLEMPNLRQKSDVLLRRKLGSWLFGFDEPIDPFLPQKRQSLFAFYSIAAVVYRWFVTIAILWFVYHVLEPYGLKIVGQILAAIGLGALVVRPLWQVGRFLYFPGGIEQVKKYRAAISAGGLMLLVLAAFFVPLPHRVRCTLYLKPRDAASVYVETPGLLEAIHVRAGDWLDQGQPIVSLGNVDADLAIERLEAERLRLEMRLQSLRHRAFDDEGASMEITEAEESLQSLAQQVAARKEDTARLIVRAPIAGVVIPPPLVPPENRDFGRLATWSGTPFDRKNMSAFLTPASLICQIGDPDLLEVILAIDEGDVEFLSSGQQVDVFLEQLPGRSFHSKIEQLSQVDMKIAPRSLSSSEGGSLVARKDSHGLDRPLNTTYQANAYLEDRTGLMLIGATGQGRIHARPLTIAQRCWRLLCQTFSFEV